MLKTATFAVVHFTVAFTVGYLITGSFVLASAVALIEPMVNTVAYYFHEIAWNRWVGKIRNAVNVQPERALSGH
jgi:uncharacterized membrane protein